MDRQINKKLFAKQGAPIILLSESEAVPFSNVADLSLVAPSKSISMFDSFSACLAFIESLSAAMAHLLEKETVYDRFDKADSLFGQFSSFT